MEDHRSFSVSVELFLQVVTVMLIMMIKQSIPIPIRTDGHREGAAGRGSDVVCLVRGGGGIEVSGGGDKVVAGGGGVVVVVVGSLLSGITVSSTGASLLQKYVPASETAALLM